ncbi:hypothetical protein ABF87_11015 [Nitrosomonas sp. JL21]|uniref:hypothetical protein n=1 Tax=Nitrosomonas sp. JL21 TaxID=153949 RepID=UPI00136A102A|nr:hypothetical protein [Nitrosomonas sp. JL21]MBL8496905.1 hypothetical protein [Nitrosomonas sp.]MCC7090342.1 hypothetical protein [Nitrosomonas sp.]MXS78479.1 hypothetical protein [Nitrosomonas sp. JL21]
MTDNEIITFVILPIGVGIGLINRFFFLKGGCIIKMDGWIPRIAGRRKENSKWAGIIGDAVQGGILIMFLYFGITYLQQEYNKNITRFKNPSVLTK